MNLVLFDEEAVWKRFLPFTYTRPVSEIRIGILTIREKWERLTKLPCSYQSQDYLQKKFPLRAAARSVFIVSNVLPDDALAREVVKLATREALYCDNRLVAFAVDAMDPGDVSKYTRVDMAGKVERIAELWDIFSRNASCIEQDFRLLTNGRASQPLPATVTVIGDPSLVFLEPGAVVEGCTLNTKGGPVYVGADAEIMEGSLVRGPFALCDHSALKMGAKVYGATTIGPHCKVGGEVSNSVIFGYSNKAHDGFLGNSVIGEWCNLGADTNNSNLKNNYGNVKVFSFADGAYRDSGLQFCGLFMADHSKAGINTMFNTGTVVGTGCNVYGGGFPPTAVPNFSWGGAEGFSTYQLEKLAETAVRVFARRGLSFDETERELLAAVFARTV